MLFCTRCVLKNMLYIHLFFIMGCFSQSNNVAASLGSSVSEQLSVPHLSSRGVLTKTPSLDSTVTFLNSSYKSKNASLNSSQKPQKPRDIGMIADEVCRLRARSLDRLPDRCENAAWLQKNEVYLKKLVEAQQRARG